MLTEKQEDAQRCAWQFAKDAHELLARAAEVAACNRLWGMLEKVMKAREATSVIYPADPPLLPPINDDYTDTTTKEGNDA